MFDENKNLLIAIVASVAIFAGWHYFYQKPKVEAEQAQQAEKAAQKKISEASSPASVIQPQAAVEVDLPKPRESIVKASKRIRIETSTLKGSLRLNGARLDDLILRQYKETTDENSKKVSFFSPAGTESPYFAEFGWVSSTKSQVLPNSETEWTADQDVLTPTQPVTLTWENGTGLKFQRTISVDEDYLFTVKQKITNTSSQPLTLNAYGLISRTGTPKTSGYFILHEGPLGYLNDSLEEYKYTTLQEEKMIKHDSTGGWLGITDKYWLAALIPDQSTKLKTNFRDVKAQSTDRYQVDYLSEAIVLRPGAFHEVTNHLFAGAKILELLDGYEDILGVKHFDLAVDFGWFYFITKPFFYALNFLKGWIGNLGLAILLMTVILKLFFFPLANKSYRSMGKMKALQPKMDRIRRLYGDDKMRMNQEVMALYKKEKVNPVSGCLPMLIQIPVFFALYKVLFVSIEMRQAPFYGWIHDLSLPDPTTIFNLFGLIPWDPPSFLMLGAWPLLMGVTMFLQQKLNPPPADPVQAKVFMVMPIAFTIMLAQFPAGLVIYWAWNNILSIIQQWFIMRSAAKKG